MRTKFLIVGMLWLLSCPFLASADEGRELSLSNFNKRFILIRENGKLMEVRDRFLTLGFKIRPVVAYYKGLISSEQALMALSPESYKAQIDKTFQETYEATPDYLNESLVSLQNIDIEKVFSDPKFNELLGKFEARIDQELAKIGLITLARPYDAQFFYKRQALYEIVKAFLNLAKSQLGEVPVLNTAMFIIQEAERMIRQRRTFHQNMLLHYLENFKEEELGLTHDEANMIWSSVYESRIPWYAFWETDFANQNWMKYGTDRFFQSIRLANTRLRDQSSQYQELGARHNFAFQDAKLKNKKVIINLFDTKDMFSRRQAVAYYYDSPNLVIRQRLLLQLGQLGLSFLSIPGFIKDFTGSYLKSMYENQRLTEGALVGYFESREQYGMAQQMAVQNVNPFESYEF
ncbi:MAG: hypothetical protein A2X86_11595 [Bdellovibrionales bacterium GWA2_49_15]|nr:MAG: hypothetical protein A2X86_11595 [Bdellovibrionales bacterium GWA2_49_15]HAZ12605.1 hypothetical protein [Bdellovibrionales bacterium]